MIKQNFILLITLLMNALPYSYAVAQTPCPIDLADKEQACLKAKLEESYYAIKKAKDDIEQTILHWDQDSMFLTTLRKSLANTDEKFWQYRSSECGFEAALPAQGYDATRKIAQLTCEITLNEQRAKQLKHALENYAPIRWNSETQKMEKRESAPKIE